MKREGKRRVRASTLRVLSALGVAALVCLGLALHTGTGTPSSFGIADIAALCPLGGVEAAIASRTVVPPLLIGLAVVVALTLLLGRAFCAWGCPVPLLRRVFRGKKASKRDASSPDSGPLDVPASERGGLRDSRNWVLGGALLSTAVFGFPVFCLVCPIGLTFATVLVVWRLFAAGDMTWSVVLIPLLLVVELVFLRKWCTRFCPMAGLMNLVSRFSKTWRPVIDESKCLETVNGAACSKCAIACEADINLRHPDFGERTLADCTRCRACVDACPAKAVSMPFLVKKGAGPQASTVVLADIDEKTAE